MAAMASRAVGGTPLVVALSTTSASSLNSNQNIVAGIRTGSATSTATARKLSDFDGLKACHGLAPKAAASTEARFAAVVASIRGGRRRSGGGGALSASCDIGAEIIRVVPIMSALVLVGVAFGFVLLRIEASVEEAEE